jgi:alpha-1,3-rhamnosyl/mannosyltransferase
LRVTLDVDFIAEQNGGIGRYAIELAHGLARHPEVALGTWARGRIIPDFTRLQRGDPIFRGHRLLRPYRQWRDRRRAQGSVFHAPNYFLPDFIERGVITVHDLSVFRFPESHPIERVRHFEERFASSLARASMIITDTETVRQEVLAHFDLAHERVKAVHLGVQPSFRPHGPEELALILSRWGLAAGGYGLSVSQLEPRKKLAELIRAWRGLPTAARSRFPLVIAGGSGWRNEEIHREIDEGQREGWLQTLGYVPEELLPALYAGARLFAYPSVYEGFGLPPLEAMASGVPVAVSDRSCLPEVCGTAPLFVDPDDEAAFTDRLRKGLEDEEWRASAIRSGIERAAGFSWNRTIEGTVAVYREAARA